MSRSEEILNQVFSNVVQNKCIIRDSEPLMEKFVPEAFPNRDDQIRSIAEAVSPVLIGRQPSNLSIYGKTGTGKTAVTRWVLSRLADKAKENSVSNLQICYVNYRILGGPYRIIVELCKQLGIDKINKIPCSGLALGELFDRFREGLDSQKKTIILVIDEVDWCIEKERGKPQGNNLLYDLNRIQLSQSKIVIIGIANRESKEWLDAGTLSTLKTEEVHFLPYNATEIGDILRQRANLALFGAVLDEGSINVCAALAAAEHGDARRALNLLRVAAELAIRRNNKSITEKHVRDAENSIDFDRVIQTLKDLPAHMKALIISVFAIGETKVVDSSQHTTGRLYETYSKLCKQMIMPPLTQRRVSQLINEMEAMGLIHAVSLNLGHYGRTKKITLGVAPSTIIIALEEHPVYGDIIRSHLPFYA